MTVRTHTGGFSIRTLIAGLVAACVMLGAAGAPAAPDAATVIVGGHFVFGDDDPFPVRVSNQSIPTVVIPLTILQGNNVTVLNRDVEGHNITSVDTDPDGEPLFRMPSIGQNEVGVLGTAHLDVGSYAFICTIHNEFMQGTLTVI